MQRVCGRIISNFQSHHFINRLRLYSTTSTTDSLSNYFVHSLGFSYAHAAYTSKRISKFNKVNYSNFDSNANSVVGFLKFHCFDDTHIRKIMSVDPTLLCSDVENTLKPKLQFLQQLQDQGFSGSDIIQAIVTKPQLLGMTIESSVLPSIQILRQVMVCDAHVIALFKKLNYPSFEGVVKYLLPNVDLLSDYGVPIELIRKHILLHPDTYLQKPKKLKDRLMRVEDILGITRDSRVFLYGVQLFSVYSEETIESKCRIFKNFGWTQSDVESFIMKNVSPFTLSDASFTKKLDFLMSGLQLTPGYLISHISLFTSSLEKSVMPRQKVLGILKEKGLVEKCPSLDSAVCMSERSFLKRFVLPFTEVHEAYAKHTGCRIKMKGQENAESADRLS